MEKTDVLKFGKYKGKSYAELLEFEAGQSWLTWWSETPSQGKYANYENKQKTTVKEWLGQDPKDTRTGTTMVDISFMMNKLEIIEKLCLSILDGFGKASTETSSPVTAWEEEV